MDETKTLKEITQGAQDWRYSSATANVRQGVNIYKNGKREWWEEVGRDQYRLVHTRDMTPDEYRGKS